MFYTLMYKVENAAKQFVFAFKQTSTEREQINYL
jgi:hypothetical protein